MGRGPASTARSRTPRPGRGSAHPRSHRSRRSAGRARPPNRGSKSRRGWSSSSGSTRSTGRKGSGIRRFGRGPFHRQVCHRAARTFGQRTVEQPRAADHASRARPPVSRRGRATPASRCAESPSCRSPSPASTRSCTRSRSRGLPCADASRSPGGPGDRSARQPGR